MAWHCRMMKITLELPTDTSLALRRFAAALGEELEDAAGVAMREYLIGCGMLELSDYEGDGREGDE